MNGRCPCGGELAEARGRRVGNDRFVLNPAGSLIKTKCSLCGRFYGYRFVEVGRHAQRTEREAEAGEPGGSDGALSGLWEGSADAEPELDLLV